MCTTLISCGKSGPSLAQSLRSTKWWVVLKEFKVQNIYKFLLNSDLACNTESSDNYNALSDIYDGDYRLWPCGANVYWAKPLANNMMTIRHYAI